MEGKMINWDKRRKLISLYNTLSQGEKNSLTRLFNKAGLTEEQKEYLKYHTPDVLWRVFKKKD